MGALFGPKFGTPKTKRQAHDKIACPAQRLEKNKNRIQTDWASRQECWKRSFSPKKSPKRKLTRWASKDQPRNYWLGSNPRGSKTRPRDCLNIEESAIPTKFKIWREHFWNTADRRSKTHLCSRFWFKSVYHLPRNSQTTLPELKSRK